MNLIAGGKTLGISKVIKVHSLANMTVCIEPIQRLTVTQNFDVLAVLQEWAWKSVFSATCSAFIKQFQKAHRPPQINRIHHLGNTNVCKIKYFSSEQKTLTNIAILGALLLPGIKPSIHVQPTSQGL